MEPAYNRASVYDTGVIDGIRGVIDGIRAVIDGIRAAHVIYGIM
jgi:hypothetical protein